MFASDNLFNESSNSENNYINFENKVQII